MAWNKQTDRQTDRHWHNNNVNIVESHHLKSDTYMTVARLEKRSEKSGIFSFFKNLQNLKSPNFWYILYL